LVIDDIKSALENDLTIIKTSNGYNNTIKKVYRKVKYASDLNIGELPCFSISIPTGENLETNEPPEVANLDGFIFGYKSIKDAEDPESELLGLYEDVISRLDNTDSYLYQNDNVQSYMIKGFGLDPSENVGYIVMPMRITITN